MPVSNNMVVDVLKHDNSEISSLIEQIIFTSRLAMITFVEIHMKYHLKMWAIVFLSGPSVSIGNIHGETHGYTVSNHVTFTPN